MPMRSAGQTMETTMKTLIKGAIVALAVTGASMAITASPSPANAAASFGFYVGPDGARIGYSEGYYYDRYGYRHSYRYPREWRRYQSPPRRDLGQSPLVPRPR